MLFRLRWLSAAKRCVGTCGRDLREQSEVFLRQGQPAWKDKMQYRSVKLLVRYHIRKHPEGRVGCFAFLPEPLQVSRAAALLQAEKYQEFKGLLRR